jgi:hypothetical protein
MFILSPISRIHTGSQHNKCRARAPFYTPDSKPPGYPEETKREAVRLYWAGDGELLFVGRIGG